MLRPSLVCDPIEELGSERGKSPALLVVIRISPPQAFMQAIEGLHVVIVSKALILQLTLVLTLGPVVGSNVIVLTPLLVSLVPLRSPPRRPASQGLDEYAYNAARDQGDSPEAPVDVLHAYMIPLWSLWTYR